MTRRTNTSIYTRRDLAARLRLSGLEVLVGKPNPLSIGALIDELG